MNYDPSIYLYAYVQKRELFQRTTYLGNDSTDFHEI